MRTEPRTVSDVMEREVASLTQDEHLDLAEDVMRLGRVRHMPVLDGDRVIGIVSQRDLLAASLSKTLAFDASERRTFLRSIVVAEVMSRDVETIAPDASLRDAAERMLERHIGCLPVVDAGRFLGMVTGTDLLRACLLGPIPDEAEVIDASELGGTEARPHTVERELRDLRRIRDELRVQLHLGRAEARDLWEGLERSWHDLEAKMRVNRQRAEKPLEALSETGRRLVDEIRDGYQRIRKLL
jgi:CBS domain-containing protein